MPCDPKHVVCENISQQTKAQQRHHASPRQLPRRQLGQRSPFPPTHPAPEGRTEALVHSAATVKARMKERGGGGKESECV